MNDPNIKSRNESSVAFDSLSTYLDRIEDNSENSPLTARLMALALPVFAFKSAVYHALTTAVQIPMAIGQAIVGGCMMLAPNNSLSFKYSFVFWKYWPVGVVDVVRNAFKVVFCATSIILGPVIGLIKPSWNIKIHRLCGFRTLEAKAAVEAPKPVEVIENKGKNGFDAIVGMNSVKSTMLNALSVYKNPDLAKTYNLNLPNGVLMQGPPGCGKTFFVERFVEEAQKQLGKKVTLFKMSASSIGSAYRHETSKRMSALFDDAMKAAKENGTLSVVFIDEIDTLIPANKERDNQGSAEERGQFLQLSAEAGQKNILIIGATNHPEKIDPEVIRAGRFDYKIEIGKPDVDMRKQLLQSYLKDIPVDGELDYQELAENLDGSNIADIAAIVSAASRLAFNKSIASTEKTPVAIDKGLLTEALGMIKKTALQAADVVNPEDLA